MLGATTDAIALFERSYQLAATATTDAWNLYVDASIAFLRQDKPALVTAREALAGLPRPPELAADVRWPINLEIVDMLVACFSQEYKNAYGQCNE